MTTTPTGAARAGGGTRAAALDHRLPGYRYGIVLILLVITYVVAVAAPAGGWTRVAIIVLQGLTLLVAMRASRVRRFTIRLATVIVALSALAAVAAAPWSGDGLLGSFFLIGALLVGSAPIVVVRGLMRRPVIDVRTVLGALCVYVSIGMMFAFAYATIGTFGTGAFFAQQVRSTISDYLYFSFVTLTTVGYGDLTAAGGFGRAMAVLEALLGQIYLVTVVAVLVGTIGRRPPAERSAGTGGAATDADPA